jgi:hypothetical protein
MLAVVALKKKLYPVQFGTAVFDVVMRLELPMVTAREQDRPVVGQVPVFCM